MGRRSNLRKEGKCRDRGRRWNVGQRWDDLLMEPNGREDRKGKPKGEVCIQPKDIFFSLVCV